MGANLQIKEKEERKAPTCIMVWKQTQIVQPAASHLMAVLVSWCAVNDAATTQSADLASAPRQTKAKSVTHYR